MIRVLHVVTYMGVGGLETMLMNYYRELDRDKVQFDFLVHRPWEADYDEEIRSLGGKIYHINRLNPFSCDYYKELGMFFSGHPEYKIVHVHQDCLSSVILKVAKRYNIPVRIAHSHSSSQDKNLKYPVKLFFRQFIPTYATHLMACGKKAGEWMFRGRDFVILNNAIDAVRFAYKTEMRDKIRRDLNIQDDCLLIGHVGRFFWAKNHDKLIDVFAEINKLRPSKLILIGDGELRTQIETKVCGLGLRDKVLFTGIRTDINDLMQAMDVFVLPSHYEGIPVTVIEAQAAGLPCLISDKVPIECQITELAHQIPLVSSSEEWARKTIDIANVSRKNTTQDIIDAGFDVSTNAKKLSDWYLNVGKAAYG